MKHSDSLFTALLSSLAWVLSKISASIDDPNFLKLVTAISSVVLCLTALIKFVDLCIEKIPKWSAAISRRLRKPPTT